MSTSAAGEIPKVASAWNAPDAALRLEKPRKSAGSGERERERHERRGPKPTRRAAYRFDTVAVSPWNGPLLGSAYAAQVIAQALHEPERKRCAYGQTPRPPALLVDRIL